MLLYVPSEGNAGYGKCFPHFQQLFTLLQSAASLRTATKSCAVVPFTPVKTIYIFGRIAKGSDFTCKENSRWHFSV